MTIQYGKSFDIRCEGCGKFPVRRLKSFQDVVNWKKSHKWLCRQAKSPQGQFADFCADCVKGGLRDRFALFGIERETTPNY